MTTTGGGSSLTGRMGQVLDCLLRGKSEKEIARELGISVHTVHNNVKQIYREFGVCSRGELCARFGAGSVFSRQLVGAKATEGVDGSTPDSVGDLPESVMGDYSTALYELATLHGERGNLTEAIRWMTQAVSLRPTWSSSA